MTEMQPLDRTRLLQALGTPGLERLAPLAQPRTFCGGESLALEGQPADEVGIIAEGLVALRQVSLEGREHVLAYLGPGGIYGLAEALDGEAHMAGVVALSDGVALILPRTRLLSAAEEDGRLALALATCLAVEVRRLSGMARDLALYPVRARLARFLLQQAEGELPRARWTQEEIARHIGTVRDVVGRTLRAFVDEGLVRRERGRLLIVERERLEREADGQ